MKKILIVGAQGFIGSALVKHFGDLDGYHVAGIGRSLVSIGPDFINCDCADLSKHLELIKPDIIVNASGSSSVQLSFDNPDLDRRLNLTNVETMLRSLRGSSIRFINFSSAAVYGLPTRLPISEGMTNETTPISPYGKHKKMSEDFMKKETDAYGTKTLSLRVFSCYGQGQKKLLLWDMFQKLKASNFTSLELFGSGEESRDYIHVNDLCRVIEITISEAEFNGEVINVASGIETSIREIANLALSSLAPKAELIFNGETRKGDPHRWHADISRLVALGFKQQVSLSHGVRSYYQWAQNKL